MSKSTNNESRKRRSTSHRPATPSRTALLNILRPLVRDLLAEELDRLRDAGDVAASRASLAEGGAIPHDEFWKKRDL